MARQKEAGNSQKPITLQGPKPKGPKTQSVKSAKAPSAMLAARTEKTQSPFTKAHLKTETPASLPQKPPSDPKEAVGEMALNLVVKTEPKEAQARPSPTISY